MKFKNKISIVLLLVCGALIPGIQLNALAQNNRSLVNPSHLDYLYQKINPGGKSMGIIHIYADYPDYKYVEAKGEGIACVDDAARAGIFYMKYYKLKKDPEVLDKIKNINRFLVYMQASNGFFYNFIWSDYSIDSTYKTSVAGPNWWSWRAIWELTEARKFFEKNDPEFINEFKLTLDKGIAAAHKWLVEGYSDKKEKFGGIEIPVWLPHQFAADQAAIIVKAFTVYFELSRK